MLTHLSNFLVNYPSTEISSYLICQSCWKIYHWQSEHEYRTRLGVKDILN